MIKVRNSGVFHQDSDLVITGSFDESGVKITIKNNSYLPPAAGWGWMGSFGVQVNFNAVGCAAPENQGRWIGYYYQQPITFSQVASTGWPMEPLPAIGESRTYRIPYDNLGDNPIKRIDYHISKGWIDTPIESMDGFVSMYMMDLQGQPYGSNSYLRRFTLTPAAVESAIGSLSGTVVDQNGSPIADVSVLLQNLETFTNSAGRYAFTGIPVGNYSLTFAKVGYQTLVL